MAEEERRNPMEREISSIRSSSSGAGEPSASAASSSVAVAGDQTNAQEDAQNNGELFPIAEGTGVGNSENYAAAAEDKHRCCVCKNEFKTKKALYGHMRTHPRDRRGLQPPSAAAAATAAAAAAAAAEQQGRDVRESDEVERRGRNVRESAAAVQSSPVRESVPNYQSAEDVKRRKTEYVVNQLLFLAEKSRQRPQCDDGGSGENNIASDNSTAGGGSGSGSGSGGSGEVIMKDGFNEPANISVIAAGVETGAGAGVAVGAINGTVSDGKKGTSWKKKGSSSSSSSAAGGSGAHTCEKCGRTFATGQSLGGHMRKHYEGPLIINKKRAREQQEETPALPAARRVQEPAAPTGHIVAFMAAAEERMVSYFNAPLESHNPALLSRSAQASNGGDYGRNREEPAGPSAGNGARRLHDFDLNEPAEPGEEPENAPQLEPERKDDDGDDALLSFRLGHFDFRRSSQV